MIEILTTEVYPVCLAEFKNQFPTHVLILLRQISHLSFDNVIFFPLHMFKSSANKEPVICSLKYFAKEFFFNGK